MSETRDDATAAALGAVFLSEGALDILDEQRIRPEHFRRPAERAIYGAMLSLRAAGQPVDELTVKAWIDGSPGPATRADVDRLNTSVPAVGNLRGYCQIVRDAYWFDQAKQALLGASEGLERYDRDRVLQCAAAVDTIDSAPTQRLDLADEFIGWYESSRQGIPFPFAPLTEATGGGMQPGEVTVLGGWSRMGKSFFLKDILVHAHRNGARCHEYANEMHGPRRTARVVASLTGISVDRIRKRELDVSEWRLALNVLKDLPYETTPTAGWSIEDYCRDLRRNKWDLCAIDTVNNLGCRDTSEWDHACVALADCAAQTGTHLIEVSQLNQERDKTMIQPPPTGRDLRNSGSWFHRGRIVILLHRDQELLDMGTGQVRRLLPDGHIRVDKASHGDLSAGGLVAVTFNPRWLRFEQLDDYRLEAAA